jgi:hypothetical protein
MDSVHDHLAVGLPHSEIHGSKSARLSPRLFAACYVLHRLLVPRHPPNALQRLISTFPSEPFFHLRSRRSNSPISSSPRSLGSPRGTCAHSSIPRSCDRESAERAILLQTLRRFASKPAPHKTCVLRFAASTLRSVKYPLHLSNNSNEGLSPRAPGTSMPELFLTDPNLFLLITPPVAPGAPRAGGGGRD